MGKPMDKEVETYKLYLVILPATWQYTWNSDWGQIVEGFGYLAKEFRFYSRF